MSQEERPAKAKDPSKDALQSLLIVMCIGSLLILGGLVAAFVLLAESVH